MSMTVLLEWLIRYKAIIILDLFKILLSKIVNVNDYSIKVFQTSDSELVYS